VGWKEGGHRTGWKVEWLVALLLSAGSLLNWRDGSHVGAREGMYKGEGMEVQVEE
jgi:hypothetical protein